MGSLSVGLHTCLALDDLTVPSDANGGIERTVAVKVSLLVFDGE